MDDADEPSDEDDIAIMKKQMVSRANDLSSQSRASTAVEEPWSVARHVDLNADDLYDNPPAVKEGVSAARYANDKTDDSDSDTNQEWSREPTPPADIAIMKKQKTGRVPGIVPSRSRSSTAVEEIVPATGYTDVNADRGSWSHVSSASNNTAPVAHTSKGKSKAIDYDSLLTDVDEDASVRKKRKKGGKSSAAVRKSTHTRK